MRRKYVAQAPMVGVFPTEGDKQVQRIGLWRRCQSQLRSQRAVNATARLRQAVSGESAARAKAVPFRSLIDG